ncbi:DUF2292 domain-containing protein [Candidatus Formimonas warabiya]|uniref:DUF2292 domain-containing protein n=1 Tax=Formimonas warabiya TaxID=1761012 RepID=UPI0011D07071|nr:DUF2292 domain-containing protein [Candidatus Formimonas warabiya]
MSNGNLGITNGKKPYGKELEQVILEIIQNVKNGLVTVVKQDYRVVQINTSERFDLENE